MVSGSLALLYFLLSFHGGRQGSGLRLAGWLAGPQACLAGPQAWLAGPQAWLDGPEGGNGRMYGRMAGWKISSFYRSLSPIGAAALPPPMKTKEKV